MQHQLILHLDGARLFNALVAKNEKPAIMEHFFIAFPFVLIKVSDARPVVCLLGTEKFIHQARRVRKVFGGGLRQAGFLAATALYALDHQC